MYKHRTAAERCNNRIKCDYAYESGHHRSTMMWYIRLLCIMSLIHLDKWASSAVKH